MAEEKIAHDQLIPESLVIKALDCVYVNGFGFQCKDIIPVGTLVVANIGLPRADNSGPVYFDEIEQTSIWRAALRLDERFEIRFFLGHSFIKLYYTLFDRIPDIIQYALDHGFWIYLRTELGQMYQPGETFIPEDEESRFVDYFNSLLEQNKLFFERNCSEKKPDNFVAYTLDLHFRTTGWKLMLPWNWNTTKGQAFCQMLRTECPDLIEGDEVKFNYYNWPRYMKALEQAKVYDFSTWWRAPPPFKP